MIRPWTSTLQSSLCRYFFVDLQVGNARGDLLGAYAIKISHQFQHKDIVVGWRAKPGLKNMNRHQTSTLQSSLCRDSFVALQVGNARGNVVFSYATKNFPHQFQNRNTGVGRRVKPGLKTWAVIELQCGRALSTKIRLWLCKWGMQEGMQYFHTLQNFGSSVSALKHWSRPKSQT